MSEFVKLLLIVEAAIVGCLSLIFGAWPTSTDSPSLWVPGITLAILLAGGAIALAGRITRQSS